MSNGSVLDTPGVHTKSTGWTKNAQWAYFLTVTNTFCTGQNIIVDGGESINRKFIWKD